MGTTVQPAGRVFPQSYRHVIDPIYSYSCRILYWSLNIHRIYTYLRQWKTCCFYSFADALSRQNNAATVLRKLNHILISMPKYYDEITFHISCIYRECDKIGEFSSSGCSVTQLMNLISELQNSSSRLNSLLSCYYQLYEDFKIITSQPNI